MPSCPQLTRIPYRSRLDGQMRECFAYLPRGYDDEPERSWPLMLFLHGNGERGNGREDLDYVLCHGPLYEAWIQKRELPFVIVSPQLPMFDMDQHNDYLRSRRRLNIPQRLQQGVPRRPERFATPQAMAGSQCVDDMSGQALTLPLGWEQVEEDLLELLAYAQHHLRADPARTYITGISYGGFGTWWMASKHPELFAAMAPVVGWGHPDLMAPIAVYHIPLWAFAGGRDSTIELKYFYAGLNRLEELGHRDVRFTVHADMEHDAWQRVYSGRDLYDWLLDQKLG